MCTCVPGSPCMWAHTHTDHTLLHRVRLHSHRDTYIWTPALPRHHGHSGRPAGRRRTHTPGARSTQQAGPEPASPAKREMPAPREATMGGTGWQPLSQPREPAGTWSSPGGRCRPAGAGQGEELLGAQSTHLRPQGRRWREHHPPWPLFFWWVLVPVLPRARRTPSPTPALLASPQPSLHASPGHHLVVHFHYAVGVTAPRPAEGGG